jgi:hypothetical protein
MADRKDKSIIGFDGLLDHIRQLSTGCYGKQAFENVGMARRIAARSRKRGNGRVDVYKCPICHAFHIGNSNHGDGR